VFYRPNFRLPSNTAMNFYSSHVSTRYYSITTTEMKLLCAPINPWVKQRNPQPFRREFVDNVFNAYNIIKNRLYRLVCPVFAASFYYEKSTLRCDILGTTYRIRAKHFLCTNCLKYTTAHRP